MPSVTKESWQTLPPPECREPLGYQALFKDAEADCLIRGLKPEEMEDKWFVYFEDGWLYLHRSWTGALIYWLKLEGSPAGSRVTESWVNRDPGQYAETDIAYDRSMLDFLIRRMLLSQDVPFPIRASEAASSPKGIYQHHIVGRAFPEKEVPDGSSG